MKREVAKSTVFTGRKIKGISTEFIALFYVIIYENPSASIYHQPKNSRKLGVLKTHVKHNFILFHFVMLYFEV